MNQDWRNRTFLELDTAAAIAGVTTRHFRRIIASEGIPVMRLGKKAILLKNDVLKLEEQRKGRRTR